MQQKADIDQTYRTMVIIWMVLLLSQFALFGFAYSFYGEAAIKNLEYGFSGPNPPVVIGAIILAFSNLMISFFINRRSQTQAVTEQNVKLVQTGLIIGCALCESISIIGMVLVLVFAYPYFHFFFALGIAGIFLHFPRRQQLLDASIVKNREH